MLVQFNLRRSFVYLQIDLYEKLYEEVSRFENCRVFSGWLQVDCKPFKHALLNVIKRWSLMFKKCLIDQVTNGYSFNVLRVIVSFVMLLWKLTAKLYITVLYT